LAALGQFQLGNGGGGADWVGVKGPWVHHPDVPVVVGIALDHQGLHDLFPAHQGAARHAAGNNLTQGCQIRGNAQLALGATRAIPEARHNLVKYQWDTPFGRQFSQLPGKLRTGGGLTLGGAGGFHNHSGDVRLSVKEGLDGSDVVVAKVQHRLAQPLRQAP